MPKVVCVSRPVASLGNQHPHGVACQAACLGWLGGLEVGGQVERQPAGSGLASVMVAAFTTAPAAVRRHGTCRWVATSLSRRRNAGTTVSGSGRSEMSSPGNAAWCISVRMSPGSNQYTLHVGFLGGEHVRQLLERRLRRPVAAPSGVALDGGVGGDVDHGAAVCAQQRQRRLQQCQWGDDVDREHVLELVERVVGQNAVEAMGRGCWRC